MRSRPLDWSATVTLSNVTFTKCKHNGRHSNGWNQSFLVLSSDALKWGQVWSSLGIRWQQQQTRHVSNSTTNSWSEYLWLKLKEISEVYFYIYWFLPPMDWSVNSHSGDVGFENFVLHFRSQRQSSKIGQKFSQPAIGFRGLVFSDFVPRFVIEENRRQSLLRGLFPLKYLPTFFTEWVCVTFSEHGLRIHSWSEKSQMAPWEISYIAYWSTYYQGWGRYVCYVFKIRYIKGLYLRHL